MGNQIGAFSFSESATVELQRGPALDAFVAFLDDMARQRAELDRQLRALGEKLFPPPKLGRLPARAVFWGGRYTREIPAKSRLRAAVVHRDIKPVNVIVPRRMRRPHARGQGCR